MSSLVTPSIEKLRPYEAGKPIEELERELGIENAIKLASNENPFGPSPKAIEAIGHVLGESHRYPDASAFRLRERLAAKLGVDADSVIQGNGSNELLELLVRTFTTPSHHIVFATPAFVVYELAALAHGVPYTAVPLREDTHDLSRMAEAVTEQTRVMFIANPNNPTGTHVSKEAVERLLREVPERVIIAVDEAYFEYADAPDYPDCLMLRSLRERLVVLRTFSKIYGLAALRVGYAVAPPELVGYMNRIRAPFNVSTVGQAAAVAALDDTDHVEKSRRLNREGRDRLERELRRMGLRVTNSQANFVYVDLGRPARPVYERLLRLGVIVRPFGGLPDKLRITVGTPPENDRLCEALVEALS
jgi:histidinol-phosphate aminotransferase